MFAEFAAAVVFSTASVAAPAPIEWTPPPTAAKYGTIVIPAIDIRAPIRQLPLRGKGKRVLDRAVGHVSSTYSPGMGGTSAFFGHNVTPTLGLPHGPFHQINKLKRGSKIIVRMSYGRFTYEVTGRRIVDDEAWGAFKPRLNGEQVLLAKCWPDGSSKYRYVIKAEYNERR